MSVELSIVAGAGVIMVGAATGILWTINLGWPPPKTPPVRRPIHRNLANTFVVLLALLGLGGLVTAVLALS